MWETKRVLIWGKTYPELSTRHRETVCTGGCLEDGGPVRLYPVPLRYLEDGQQYSLWDWIEVPIAPSAKDRRPESRKVKSRRIKKLGHLDTGRKRDWAARREIVFRDPSWRYECVADLVAAQRDTRLSLGLVKVGRVESVRLRKRPEEDRLHHEEVLKHKKDQADLFNYDQKDLEFFPHRVQVRWYCERLEGEGACRGHTAQVLDWGLGQLGRREGPSVMLDKMEEVCDLDTYDLHFFMGNFKAYPRSFGIVGLWYPKLENLGQLDLLAP